MPILNIYRTKSKHRSKDRAVMKRAQFYKWEAKLEEEEQQKSFLFESSHKINYSFTRVVGKQECIKG